jgi:flagellar M-ring protein FliF
MKLLQSMSMRQRLVLGGSVLAVVVVAFLLLKLASAPSYSLIATGLDPAKTGKMTAALDAQGIPYELRNNGTALAVEKNSTAQASIALADAGLSTSGSDGASSGLDKVTDLKMGASTFQQKIAYQQGLEQTIEDTLNSVNGVSGATVQLTLPEDQLFQDEAKPTTASVLLSGDSGGFDSAAVKGMANLVANAVQGLKPENVTITDESGTMLWPADDGSVASGAMSKQAAENRFEAQMEAQLNALVARTIGVGKGQVSVNADLNVDDTSVEKLEYAKKGSPIESTTQTETLKGKGAGAGTAAGTTTNIPGYAQNGAGSGGNSNYKNTDKTTKQVFGKTVTRTQVAPGSITREDVSLVVDKSVPAADVRALQTAIASAAGIDRQRGDTLAVSQITFAKSPTTTTSNGPLPSGGIMGYAKYALLGLAALIFLFFISRHLRRRENEVIADPSWLRQLDAPTPIAQLEDPDAPPPSLLVGRNPRKKQIEEVVTKEPERVATALRTWMNE